jgi:thiol-disulfide isomerase/thioredoxin
MHRTLIVVLCLILTGCQPEDSRQRTPTSANNTPATPSEPQASVSSLESNKADAPIPVSFAAGDPKSELAPRYSPPGKGLKLEPRSSPTELGVDGLQAEVVLGAPAEKQSPLKLLVTRASAEAPYTKLYIDTDGNNQFDEPGVEAKLSESRGKIWSNFEVTLPVKYLGATVETADYPVAFWLTVAAATDQPDLLRMSRRGFKTGQVSVAGASVAIVLSDSNNDAVFEKGDWWELRSDNGQFQNSNMRSVGDFAWLGETAFKLELENPFGSSARLVPFDPGITPEADALARDPYAADKKAAKATKPLEFRHDVDAAIAEAAEKKLPCFIKFETTWCGPCKMMTQMVFTAQDVVEAAEGTVCVMVDGDERKDLVERYTVKGYPTGLLITAEGTESARFIGYQNVKQMTAFLKEKRSQQ